MTPIDFHGQMSPGAIQLIKFVSSEVGGGIHILQTFLVDLSDLVIVNVYQ